MIKLAGKSRLTRQELEDIRDNSGITNLQYEIVKYRYYDPHEYSIVKVCDILKISVSCYSHNLKKAETQIDGYFHANFTSK